MGDTVANLARACEAINALDGVQVVAVSAVYHTEPQDKRDQDWFANQVARLECRASLTPEDLLAALLAIESSMGRRRSDAPEDRYGPRVIDLDLLLFGNARRHTPDLVLPHPRMQERAFVLIPLRDVAPALAFPDGKTLVDALEQLSFRLEEQRIWQ